MMNVPLIFYAARETGDRDLYDLAVAHCRTTERTLVRPDGSTAHEGIFDPDTGAFLRQSTHQGLRADSSWTRGLAWSLYGFGTVFTYTHDPADLQVAQRNADCYLARCPAGLVPPWDFDVPEGPDRIDDSSAAAIAASGLWNLAELTATRRPGSRAQRYRECDPDDPRHALHRPLHGMGRPRLARRARNTASIISTKSWASTSRSCGASFSSSKPSTRSCVPATESPVDRRSHSRAVVRTTLVLFAISSDPSVFPLRRLSGDVRRATL